MEEEEGDNEIYGFVPLLPLLSLFFSRFDAFSISVNECLLLSPMLRSRSLIFLRLSALSLLPFPSPCFLREWFPSLPSPSTWRRRLPLLLA